MDFFTFIIVVVAIVSGTEMVGKIFGASRRRPPPLEKGSERNGHQGGHGPGPPVDAELFERLDRRLERMEERLDFLEQLKAPPRRTALPGETLPDEPAS